ncbi:MAG: hypothetical protein ACAF41_00025 (plasmid) [Leptolyngbya sp. BL-A-14]
MELETAQLDLESIEVKDDFPEPHPEQVEYLAHAITSVGGLIQVPVVRQIGLETYELVRGYFEYQAYLKARKIDPKLPDRMRVFVITKKNEQAIQQQLEVFQTLSGEKDEDKIGDPELTMKLSNLISAVALLQKDVQVRAEESQSVILSAINERVPKPLPALEAFNRIDEPEITKEILGKLAGLGSKKAQKIVELLQAHQKKHHKQPFRGFGDVLEALGKGVLSKEKMLDIIDSW